MQEEATLFALRTSTATYLPLSDQATMASTLVSVAITTGLPGAALEQNSELVAGQVTKVDQSAQKITIKHGPIKSLGMDEGMTMVFRVKDPSILDQLKEGDKIKITADKSEGRSPLFKRK